jgi:hypothetical protein
MLWNMLLLAALFAFIAFLNRKDESYSWLADDVGLV